MSRFRSPLSEETSSARTATAAVPAGWARLADTVTVVSPKHESNDILRLQKESAAIARDSGEAGRSGEAEKPGRRSSVARQEVARPPVQPLHRLDDPARRRATGRWAHSPSSGCSGRTTGPPRACSRQLHETCVTGTQAQQNSIWTRPHAGPKRLRRQMDQIARPRNALRQPVRFLASSHRGPFHRPSPSTNDGTRL